VQSIFSIRMIACTITKSPNKEAVSASNNCEKRKEKDTRTDPESRMGSGSHEKKHRVNPSWKEYKEMTNLGLNTTFALTRF